jgi:exonuclease VII large subunit
LKNENQSKNLKNLMSNSQYYYKKLFIKKLVEEVTEKNNELQCQVFGFVVKYKKYEEKIIFSLSDDTEEVVCFLFNENKMYIDNPLGLGSSIIVFGKCKLKNGKHFITVHKFCNKTCNI